MIAVCLHGTAEGGIPEWDVSQAWCDGENCREGLPQKQIERTGTIHFVEVKTRTGDSYGEPADAVNCTKQQKIKKTALLWLQEQEMRFPEFCFDVIEVRVSGKSAKIRWLSHCF